MANFFAAGAAVGPSRQNYIVVAVDRAENIYLDNVPRDSSELTNAFLASGSPTIYVVGDKDVRYQAIGRILISAENAGIHKVVIGYHILTGEKLVPIQPVQQAHVDGTFPIVVATAPSTRQNDVVIIVDFDGTVLWNQVVLDRATLAATLQHLASKNPKTRIYVWPNRLSKYDTVVHLIADAEHYGLNNIFVVGIAP
ncbi:MAG TPA: biopolymer transporter ExbD [Rhizomicrobium sp.]